MSELITLDDNIVEFYFPRQGFYTESLQRWAQSIKETAGKTDRLARVVIEIRMIKWIKPEVTESKRQEDSSTDATENIVFQAASIIKKEIALEQVSDFKEEEERTNAFLDKATSYGVVFRIKAYRSNNRLIAVIHRQFGRLDLVELREASEAENKLIVVPPSTIQVGRRPVTILSRPIERPITPIDPKAEFEKLIQTLNSL